MHDERGLTILDTTIEPFLAEKKEQIEKRLETLLYRTQMTPQNTLFEAARYSLFSSGKRLRPLLALAITESHHIPIEAVLTPIATLEMVHTYSLIHDDLPCMDDDDMRRGKPSLHRAYSESTAILAGNYLLTYAFEILATAGMLSPEQKIELIRALAQGAGGDGMLGGQIIDLLSCSKEIDWDTLKQMHLGKTAKMLTASLEFGGILSHCSPKEIEILKQIGEQLGLAYQVIDDILDITGSEIDLGKKIGSDAKNNKPTAATFLGLEHAYKFAEELYESAKELIHTFPRPLPLLEELAHRLIFRNF